MHNVSSLYKLSSCYYSTFMNKCMKNLAFVICIQYKNIQYKNHIIYKHDHDMTIVTHKMYKKFATTEI